MYVYIRRSVLEYESGGGERLKVQVFPHVLPGGRRVARSSSATLCFIFLTTAGVGGGDGNYTGVTGNNRTLAKHLHSEGNAANGTVEGGAWPPAKMGPSVKNIIYDYKFQTTSNVEEENQSPAAEYKP